MRAEQLEALLADVAAGRLAPDEAIARLRHLPFEDLPFARIDHHRELRQGQPEVVFCERKTADQVVAICERLEAASGGFLGTRVPEATAAVLKARFPRMEWNALARTAFLPPAEASAPPRSSATILVVSAGTSDLPVSEEAAVVAEAFGPRVERLIDVGVAGLHRLLAAGEQLSRPRASSSSSRAWKARCPASSAGWSRRRSSRCPPASATAPAFGGLAALLGMLNSCAAGVTVVNIDNGFGAAAAASRICRP